MSRRRQHGEDVANAPEGFQAAPADGGLSIDRLAQAFAAMMGTDRAGADPGTDTDAEVVHVDASPDLDERAADDDATCRVNPATILEAMLFVGLPGGRPISSRSVAGLMRGVRPQEIDELAAELGSRCRADNCPYEVVSRDDGWVMRLRPEYARFGAVLESRARRLRLDAEALDALAVVAWNQPVPRGRLVELGCDARPAALRTLVRRGLLALERAAGEDEPRYVTTPRFLEVFRLERLEDLPKPSEPPG